MSLTFDTTHYRHELEFSDSNFDHKIGLISLSTDLTVEQDFRLMCPDHRVGVFVNRVEFINPTTRENLYAMQPELTQAASLILPEIELDVIVYACTSASAVIGDDVVRQSVSTGKPNTPIVTPTTAAVEGFDKLEVDKITLLAPYIKSVSESLAHYFSGLGLNINNLVYLDIEDDRDIGRLSHESIIDAAKSAVTTASEAIFVACTALPVVPIINRLEKELSIPVITSNQAMFWQAMHKAGCQRPIKGFGQLLENHFS